MKNLKFLLSLLLLVIFQNISKSQITIDGRITDSELNPINSVLVEIIDKEDTANYYSAITNESGYFNISDIFTDVSDRINQLPNDFIVLRNYPNPFNPSTIIYYELPRSENIDIRIYDILGREVRTLYNNFHQAGINTLEWNGRNNRNIQVAAGVYLCRLKTNDQAKVHKMLLLDGGSSTNSPSGKKISKPRVVENIAKAKSIFSFSVKVSGSNILVSDFNYFSCLTDTTLNLIVPKILQTSIIGPEGGKLETENFSLTIPAGAFVQEETLSLAIETDSVSFEEDIFSKPFRVDGIPELFYKDLNLKIKLDKSPTDSISFAVGEPETDTFLGYEFINYEYYSAEDSNGYAVTNLMSPFTNNSVLLKSNDMFNVENTNYEKKLINVLSSPGEIISSNGNFKIYYPKSKTLYIPIIDEYLEEAVQIVESLGFTKLPLRSLFYPSNWPVKVKFNNSSVGGKYLNSIDGASSWKQGKYLKENDKDHLIKNWEIFIYTDNFSKSFPDNLRRTLGRDVFTNFIHQNNLYQNDASISKWLTDTIRWWVTKSFPKEDNFIPWLYDFNNSELPKDLKFNLIKEILEGIYLDDKDDDYLEHIIAFTALIDFFTTSTEQEDKIIFELYKKIRSEKNSVDVLIKTMSQSENIWSPNFFKEFIQGNIYNVPSEEFLKNISKTIEFNDGDSLKYVDESYSDLSAKLFEININSEDIKNNKSLQFKIGPESLNLKYVKALLFGISGTSLTFISEGIDFPIGNLNKYDALLACVVNSGNERPYTGTSNIELDIRTIESNLPYEVTIDISGHFIENVHYKSETEEREYEADYIYHHWSGIVRLINDSTYYGAWDEDDQIGYHHKGEMTIIINPITKNLKYFEAKEIKDGDFASVIDEKIISNNINRQQFSNGTDWWNYLEKDGNACSMLNSLEYTKGNDAWRETMTSYYCNETSSILISFNFEE